MAGQQRTLIIAASYKDAYNYAQQEKLSNGAWVYISSTRQASTYANTEYPDLIRVIRLVGFSASEVAKTVDSIMRIHGYEVKSEVLKEPSV